MGLFVLHNAIWRAIGHHNAEKFETEKIEHFSCFCEWFDATESKKGHVKSFETFLSHSILTSPSHKVIHNFSQLADMIFVIFLTPAIFLTSRILPEENA